MANKEFLAKRDLLDYHDHFMRLTESFIETTFPEDNLAEEGEDEQDPMGGGQDDMGGGGMQDPGAPGGAPDGGMPGGDPGAGGDPMMGGGPGGSPGGDPMMGGDPNGGGMPGGDPMMGGAPDDGGDMLGGENPFGDQGDDDEEGLNDDGTIDIDGLTHAEDKLNVKQNRIGRDLAKVDNRLMSVIDAINTLKDKLEANNSELESLKSEFEKRNPTQTEKLNLRSLDSYPFNVKPTEYWKDKEAIGGYSAYADNNEPTTKEYVITNSDVDDPQKDIADTFFSITDDDIQTLDKLFGF